MSSDIIGMYDELAAGRPDPATARRARLNIVSRTVALGFSREDTLAVLQALGLVEDGQGTKTTNTGKRVGPAKRETA